MEKAAVITGYSARIKAGFLANMSREIRTPLNGILGTVELLSELEPSLEQDDLLKTIFSSGDHLLVILNDILDISKIDAGKLELEISEIDIKKCIP